MMMMITQTFKVTMLMLLYVRIITWLNLGGEDEEAPKISLEEKNGVAGDPPPAVLWGSAN
jgi:hypothetical protein